MAVRGLFGRGWISLDDRLDLGPLDAVHEEVCLALGRVPLDYTGGSHRSMGIMPPSRAAEALVDYGEVIASMPDDAFATFCAMADAPLDPSACDRRAGAFGEERDHPLSRRQMLWLETRWGVYFPWKAYVELIPNRTWAEKATPKPFSRLAEAFFPKTIDFVRSLPFAHVGRCNVMGLRANDHGTVHRDGEPDAEPDHFITLCPGADKRLYVWDEEARTAAYVTGRAYWFNDHDYHGVDADPFFRYSLRVDGVFEPSFLQSLRSLP